MPKIFISYRRDDSEDVTGRIHDHLKRHFGDEAVFMDIDSIPLGVDFRQHVQKAVGQCNILLAVIGDRWLEISHQEGPKAGQRRLDDQGDFVRIEVQAALDRDIPVIPVLVGKARMPGEAMLPPQLQNLAYRNSTEVRSGRDFHAHMDRLVRGIEQLARHETASPAREPKQPTNDVPAKKEANLMADGLEQISRVIGGDLGLTDSAHHLRVGADEIRAGRFTIVVVGGFCRGKSTLLNAVLGCAILPQRAMPSTAVITVLAYADSPRATVKFTDANRPEENLTLEDFRQRYVLDRRDSSDQADRFAQVDHAVVHYPIELCRHGAELVDTPGFDNTLELTRRTTKFLLRRRGGHGPGRHHAVSGGRSPVH